MGLAAEDHVVFIDDFSGTGRQVSGIWPTLQELIAADAACHLILTAATRKAISEIRQLINLSLTVYLTLDMTQTSQVSGCGERDATSAA